MYAAAILLLAGAVPARDLIERTTTIMGELSLAEPTILVGVLAATVSSALASTLGGPRVLQRLGEDRVLPRLDIFAKGAGPARNPRRATLVSATIALATVGLGDLNAVAPVISMFFLASYGMINYATFYEIRAGSTSFRPRFRWYDRRASLAGTLACAGAIVAINPIAGGLAGLVLVALYTYLRRRQTPDRWSDSAAAYHYTQARKHLQHLWSEPAGNRDWRPCSLVFVPRNPDARTRMLTVASWIEGGLGYTTAIRILEGSSPRLRRQAVEIEEDLVDELAETSPGTYARALAAIDVEVAVTTLIEGHGIGAVRPNMTLFGVRDLRGSEDDRRSYGEMLRGCARFGANVAVIGVDDEDWATFKATPPDQRVIGLWWSDDQVGKLITLLAWLCKRSPAWRAARVVAHVPRTDTVGESDRVAALLAEARIDAEVVQVERTAAAMAEALSGATLALAPLQVKGKRALGPFGSPVGMLVESLPLTILVLATEELDLNAQPDDVLGELAELRERIDRSERWVLKLDAEASRLLVSAEQARLAAESAESGGEDARAGLVATAEQERDEARAAFRRYVDGRTRHELLVGRLAELDPDHSSRRFDPSIWRSAHERLP